MGALVIAIPEDARDRAASRPVPTTAATAAQLGGDSAALNLASRRSGGAVSVTALIAATDIAGKFERLRRENPPLNSVVEIERLAQSRRQAPGDRALPQLCGESLTRMRQAMTRQPYLVRPQRSPAPGPAR